MRQLDADARILGVIVLRLLSTRDRWMHRRVESISFLDSIAFRRRVSVDFSIDADIADRTDGSGSQATYYAPLGFLRKRKLVGFSLRDEHERVLPMPTSAHNCGVAAAVLVAAAKRNVGRRMPSEYGTDLPEDVESDLWTIATERHEGRAIQLWDQLGRAEPELSSSSREWRRRLTADEDFMALSYDFARNFIVLVPLASESGKRRVIKYSYEYRSLPPVVEFPQWVSSARKAWFFVVGGRSAIASMKKGDSGRTLISLKDWRRVFLGWFPHPLTIDTPGVFHGGNYHLEVEAPEGLHITRAALYRHPEEPPLDIVKASVQRVHLYARDVSSADSAKTDTATATIALRVRNEVFIRAAAMIAAIAASMLVPLVFFWEDITDTVSTVPSFLLLVPTVLAAYVARSREPLATTERLFGLRLLAMSAGAWSFLAAVLLVVGRDCPEDPTRSCTSWDGTPYFLAVLAILSLLTLVALVRTLTFGARPPEQKPSQ